MKKQQHMKQTKKKKRERERERERAKERSEMNINAKKTGHLEESNMEQKEKSQQHNGN